MVGERRGRLCEMGGFVSGGRESGRVCEWWERVGRVCELWEREWGGCVKVGRKSGEGV